MNFTVVSISLQNVGYDYFILKLKLRVNPNVYYTCILEGWAAVVCVEYASNYIIMSLFFCWIQIQQRTSSPGFSSVYSQLGP